MKTPPSRYHYFDDQDRITTRFIEQHEPFAGYWHQSEHLALDRARQHVREASDNNKMVRGLDAGCGDGRLLPWVAELVTEVTAIDRDQSRIDSAKERTHQIGLRDHINFNTSSIAEYADEPFDFVLCSHVLQHVSTSEVAATLRSLYKLTNSGGMLVLCYSRAAAGAEAFTTTQVINGSAESKEVTRAEFDKLASNRSESSAVLPVRHFDPDSLEQVGIEIGWIERWRWTYHILVDLGIIDGYLDRDELVNSYGHGLQDLGRDVVVRNLAS